MQFYAVIISHEQRLSFFRGSFASNVVYFAVTGNESLREIRWLKTFHSFLRLVLRHYEHERWSFTISHYSWERNCPLKCISHRPQHSIFYASLQSVVKRSRLGGSFIWRLITLWGDFTVSPEEDPRNLHFLSLVACQMQKWFFLLRRKLFCGEPQSFVSRIFRDAFLMVSNGRWCVQQENQSAIYYANEEKRVFEGTFVGGIWRVEKYDKHVHKSHWVFFSQARQRPGGDEEIDSYTKAIIYMFLWIY